MLSTEVDEPPCEEGTGTVSTPRITRMHAAALMGAGDSTVLAVHRGVIVTCQPGEVLHGAADRILFTRSDLEDAGVEWDTSAARFTAGSGPLVDEILDDINTHLAASAAT